MKLPSSGLFLFFAAVLQPSASSHRSPWDSNFNYHRKLPADIMVDTINNFGLALLEVHNEHNDNNVAVSPYGACSVMVALLEGVVGEAAHEIQHSLNLPQELAVVRVGLRDIHRHLKSYFIPKEGFLSGLTLSHDNITLNREYESILRFYGYDIESFNIPIYSSLFTTTTETISTRTTETITTNPTTMQTTTTEMSTSTDNLSTLGTEKTTRKIDQATTATEKQTTIAEKPTTTDISRTTVEMSTTITTTSTKDVGMMETSTLTSTINEATSTLESIDSTELIMKAETKYPTTREVSSIDKKDSMSTTQLPITTSITSTSTTSNPELTSTVKEMTSTQFIEEMTTTTIPITSAITDNSSPTFTTSTEATITTESSTKATSTESSTAEIDIRANQVIGTTFTENIASLPVVTEFVTYTEESTSSTTEDFVDYSRFDYSTMEEVSSSSDYLYGTTENFVNPNVGTITELVTPNTNNEVTSTMSPTFLETEVTSDLSDLIDTNSQFNIDANLTNPSAGRKKRSVIDYVIARYYDNYYTGNRRYLPRPQFPGGSYQPEKPYTFLVDGKIREPNISFMTYDTVLPFHYVPELNAMALSFPLDSNMYYLLLVLPVDELGIDKLIYDLRRVTSLKGIVANLKYTHVRAVIPSFMFKGYVVLTPTLQKLGIRKVFEPRHADFSPLTMERDIYVTNVEQAVTVTIRNYVDPSGVPAKTLNDYRPVEFRADHPFLYFVMDSQIHVNLMSGKVVNPLNTRIR